MCNGYESDKGSEQTRQRELLRQVIKEENAVIEARGLTKKYGDHTAVKNLSFSVDKGRVLGFLGPNGAGKSTTMNMLTGYISATKGTVLINGIDIYENPKEAKKNIGYLPELPPVYPDMTVDEYLDFVCKLKNACGRNKKQMLEDIKIRTGVKDVEGRLIKHLSKGYRQRVGFAGALVGYPEVLILDEPTVGLDPKQIIEIRDLIRSLSKDHTIILSSHILSEISAVCDQIMIINKGRLVAAGSPEELTEKLGEGNKIEITALGEKEEVEQVLGSMEYVEEFAEAASDDEGLSYSLKIRKNVDARRDIFIAFAEAGIPLIKLSRNVQTLESLFLEITEGKEEKADESNIREGN